MKLIREFERKKDNVMNMKVNYTMRRVEHVQPSMVVLHSGHVITQFLRGMSTHPLDCAVLLTGGPAMPPNHHLPHHRRADSNRPGDASAAEPSTPAHRGEAPGKAYQDDGWR